MKKILLLGVASVLLSVSVFARETNSMRSSFELVSVGDSEASLLVINHRTALSGI